MRVSGQSTDYLRISPSRALWSVCAPLILVNLVLAGTTTLTNRLYSQSAGQTYFTVTGYLSVATTLFVNVVSSVYTCLLYTSRRAADQERIQDRAADKAERLAEILPVRLLRQSEKVGRDENRRLERHVYKHHEREKRRYDKKDQNDSTDPIGGRARGIFIHADFSPFPDSTLLVMSVRMTITKNSTTPSADA